MSILGKNKMFSPEVVNKARATFAHRHEDESNRINLLNQGLGELKDLQDSEQEELRRHYAHSFLLSEIDPKDERTYAEIQELIESCIISREPTKEERVLMEMGRHPVLDDATSIRGDCTKQELVASNHLTNKIEGDRKGFHLPPSETVTWNGMFDLSRSFKMHDFVKPKWKLSNYHKD